MTTFCTAFFQKVAMCFIAQGAHDDISDDCGQLRDQQLRVRKRRPVAVPRTLTKGLSIPEDLKKLVP